MLTSLFGDLGAPKDGADGQKLPSGTVESDGGFAATALLHESAAEVDERGRIVDRHLRDLFVTGSPAQAMREHFTTSRAELDSAGKWIVLLDPARIWASAIVKALSDATGQPIDRLHLRERTTLRTLAMIERTSVLRRLDDALKVYHADVRASGPENAEISLALMERANLTAVVVGPMQPHAIDALLRTLQTAAAQPTWRCPTLLFLLPPGAVWIANKIAGIAWPASLGVQVLNEPMTSASQVWNAVLATWNRLKDERGGAVLAPPADEFPIKVADLVGGDAAAERRLVASAATAVGRDAVAASEPATTPAPSLETAAATAGVATATATKSSAAIRTVRGTAAAFDPQRAAQALAGMLRSDGLLACALVDAASGEVLAREQRDGLPVDLDAAGAAGAQLLRAQRRAARASGLPEAIDEIVVGAGARQQLLRVLPRQSGRFMLALLDSQRTTLAQVRLQIADAERLLA